jgi:hypothetical protein
VSSKEQQIEDLQRELALTRLDFSTQLHRLEQKVSALTDNKDITVKTPFEEPQQTSNASEFKATESQNHLAAFDKPSKRANTTPSYIASLIKGATAVALGLLSPMTKFISPLLNLYQHYQAKGQGPIFVFMLIGIALLVGGFGYLT